MSVRYSGRAYEFVSYDGVVSLASGATLKQIEEAAEQARKELLAAHPVLHRVEEPRVSTGWGHNPPLLVVVSAVVAECIDCGGEGHVPADCPRKVT